MKPNKSLKSDTYFVDANVFLRLLTDDDKIKAGKINTLFDQSQKTGSPFLITNQTVITELVYILTSPRLYSLGRNETSRILIKLLSQRFIRLVHKKVTLKSLEIYGMSNVDYPDAVIVAEMENQKITKVLSYDRDFDRFKNIQRIEP